MVTIQLKKLLNDKDKSIYWLAENTNLTYPAIHRIANNKTAGIKLETLEMIMEALEIDDFNKIFKKE
ncbi:MAG: helix-turn-helix domain-containing protein [Bacillota bacterium]